MRFFKKRLPSGYTIMTWKTAERQKRYTVFRGDDRLMTFDNKADAIEHAVNSYKTES